MRRLRLTPFLIVGLTACAHATPLETVPAARPANVLSTLFLVGDAGLWTAGHPLLQQLQGDVRESDRRSDAPVVVAFLGDNIYEAGLRAAEPGSTEDKRTLAAQLAAIANSGASALFVPGNHDWDNGGPRGLEAIHAQAAYFAGAAAGGIDVTWAPTAGCPGPEAIDLPGLRLIALDTQWFLHGHQTGDASTCPFAEPEDVTRELTKLIDGSGSREVAVLSHHPLRTHGPHGGYFPPDRHLFPLLDFVSWGYVPLPFVGTGYVLARTNGLTGQDLSGGSNTAMRALLGGAFDAASKPPLFHAAGHEHTLQVLGGGPGLAAYQLVSGSASKSSPVGSADDTLFASSAPGYMRLEVTSSGVRVTVVPLVSNDATPRQGWCRVVDRRSRSLGACGS